MGSLRRVKYLLVIANFTHCHCCSLKFVSPQGASGPKQLLAFSFLLKRFVQILEGLTNCVVLYMRTENIYILFETQSHKQFFLFALIKAWEWHFISRVHIWGVLQTPWRGEVIHLILKPFRNTQSYFHVIIFSLNTSANLFFPRMKACIGLSTTCSPHINFDLHTRSPNKPVRPPADTTYTEQRHGHGHGHAFQHINGHTLT